MIEANVIPEGMLKPTVSTYVVQVEERLYYSEDGLAPTDIPIVRADLAAQSYIAFKRAGVTEIHPVFLIKDYPLKVVTKTSTP